MPIAVARFQPLGPLTWQAISVECKKIGFLLQWSGTLGRISNYIFVEMRTVVLAFCHSFICVSYIKRSIGISFLLTLAVSHLVGHFYLHFVYLSLYSVQCGSKGTQLFADFHLFTTLAVLCGYIFSCGQEKSSVDFKFGECVCCRVCLWLIMYLNVRRTMCPEAAVQDAAGELQPPAPRLGGSGEK